MKRLVPLVFLVALAALAPACSSGSGAGQGASASGPAEGVAPILDFTAPKLDGGEVNGADYSGEDVALWFWAPW